MYVNPMLTEQAKILMSKLTKHYDRPQMAFEVELVVKIACALAPQHVGRPEELADDAYRVYDRITRNIPGALK